MNTAVNDRIDIWFYFIANFWKDVFANENNQSNSLAFLYKENTLSWKRGHWKFSDPGY